MGWGDAFKALAGGLGGASRGAAAAYPDIMASQEQRRRTGLEWLDRQEDQEYRQAQLADQTRRTDIQSRDATWGQAYQREQMRRQRYRDETERIRVEGDIVRSQMATRQDANRELYDARLQRARTVLNQAGPDMTPGELDRLARLQGFADYGQALGVTQTAGETLPEPGSIPSPGVHDPFSFEGFPGESGEERLGRLQSAYGMPWRELQGRVRDAQIPMADPDYGPDPEVDTDMMIRRQIARIRGS